jgi:hypothetical protein
MEQEKRKIKELWTTGNNKKKFVGRTNSLISFDTTRTTQKNEKKKNLGDTKTCRQNFDVASLPTK